MFDFFSKILGYIEILWDYFLNMVESLFLALTVMTQASSFTLGLVKFMPSIIGAAIVITFGIYAARFIANRM